LDKAHEKTNDTALPIMLPVHGIEQIGYPQPHAQVFIGALDAVQQNKKDLFEPA